MAFNDFVQTELPKRPYAEADGLAGFVPVRSNNALAARELVWVDPIVFGDGGITALPDADSSDPEMLAVRQGGLWKQISWAAFLLLVGTVPSPSPSGTQVTVGGVSVTAAGVPVVVGGAVGLGATDVTVGGVGITVGGIQVRVTS